MPLELSKEAFSINCLDARKEARDGQETLPTDCKDNCIGIHHLGKLFLSVEPDGFSRKGHRRRHLWQQSKTFGSVQRRQPVLLLSLVAFVPILGSYEKQVIDCLPTLLLTRR
jgi:hypothetical protein